MMLRSNIILHELKQYRISAVIWTVVMIYFAFQFLALYPALVQDSAAFQELINSFSPEIKKLVGFAENSFTSDIGFLGVTFIYVYLVGSVQAMNLGISIISKEVQNKTSDFLLSKPISRLQSLNSKLIAGYLILIVTNLFFIPAVYLMTRNYFDEPLSLRVFLMCALSLGFLQSFFLSLGFMIGAVMHKVKSVVAISLPTVFGFYIVGMLDSVIGVERIRYFTPFKYFDFEYIKENRMFEAQFILLGIAIMIVAISFAYNKYLHKDIDSV